MRRTRSIRGGAAILAGVVGGSGLVGVPAASGAEESRAFCAVDEIVAFPKGVTASPGRIDFKTVGVAEIDCDGSIRGHAVTGKGKYTESGFIEGSCTNGVPNYHAIMTVPTAAGDEKVELKGTAQYAGVFGFRPEGDWPGGFFFAPTKGDCVTGPVTEARVYVYGWLMT